MDVGVVLAVAQQAYAIYNQCQDATDELYDLKSKLEQLIPVIESIQELYEQRDKKLFTNILFKAIEVLQQCTKLVENGTTNFLGLIKTAFSKELQQLSADIDSIINQLTLAVVTWNALANKKYSVKLVLAGKAGVGKTCFALAIHGKKFSDFIEPTIGASFHTFKDKNTDITLEIWDTAGAERYMGIFPIYGRSAQVIVLIHDISDNYQESTINWYEFIKNSKPTDCMVVLVGNKLDIVDHSLQTGKITQESRDWAKKFADENKLLYIEISCKTQENVSFCLTKILSRVRFPGANEKENENATSGYLFKVPGSWGNNIGGWQERFFVSHATDAAYVYYYRSNNDYRRKKYAGRICVAEVESVQLADEITQKRNSLIVHTKPRTWYLYANTQDEQIKWLNWFTTVCSNKQM